jgi:hypothetical protein
MARRFWIFLASVSLVMTITVLMSPRSVMPRDGGIAACADRGPVSAGPGADREALQKLRDQLVW